MDLVATVRKEGSRGGRGDFKWSDVQASQHRENYLGHSLMAPVGRWQKGRDLSWYAKSNAAEDASDGLSPEERAKKERAEELQQIKAAEEEALSKALGWEINKEGPFGSKESSRTGANAVPITTPAFSKKERSLNTPEASSVNKHRERESNRKHHHHSRREHHRRYHSRRSEDRHRSRSRTNSRSRSRERHNDAGSRQYHEDNYQESRRRKDSRGEEGAESYHRLRDERSRSPHVADVQRARDSRGRYEHDRRDRRGEREGHRDRDYKGDRIRRSDERDRHHHSRHTRVEISGAGESRPRSRDDGARDRRRSRSPGRQPGVSQSQHGEFLTGRNRM